MSSDPQAEFRKELASWLKARRLSRKWLAEQCYVAVGTVYCWLSHSPITPLREKQIRDVMAAEENRQEKMSVTLGRVSLNMSLSTSEYDAIMREIGEQGLDFEDWLINAAHFARENSSQFHFFCREKGLIV